MAHYEVWFIVKKKEQGVRDALFLIFLNPNVIPFSILGSG